jgi:hypothetical protein
VQSMPAEVSQVHCRTGVPASALARTSSPWRVAVERQDLLEILHDIRNACGVLIPDPTRCSGQVAVVPAKTKVRFTVRTAFPWSVTRNLLDVMFVLGGRSGHRRIKKSQEEFPRESSTPCASRRTKT